MARLARLSLAGVAHLLRQRGHNGSPIVHGADDADQLLQVLREAALDNGVTLHAYAVQPSRLQLLATPSADTAISRLMQDLGRRYAAWFNRRHGRSGALWDGRFRSALVGPGAPTLMALRLLDSEAGWTAADAAAERDGGSPVSPAQTVATGAAPRSSAPHRVGGRRDVALVDPPEYWQLGNTPFERELRYRALLAEPLHEAEREQMEQALRGSWVYGDDAFRAQLGRSTARPLAPRARGRPRA